MRYIVTGAAGFIGSNLVKKLNSEGHTDIICVDDLSKNNIQNIQGLEYSDFISIDDISSVFGKDVDTVFHLGAISNTRADNWKEIYQNNITFTKQMFDRTRHRNFVFASSASVYGDSKDTLEIPANEAPKNLYAASKLICDNWLRSQGCQYQSWRFFNVYGHRETSKLESNSSSPYTTFKQQISKNTSIKIFEGSDKIFRDFISVDDVVEVMYRKHSDKDTFVSNLGTGTPSSFNEWAELFASKYKAKIELTEFPEDLKKGYQYYTCSNNSTLNTLLDYKFKTIKEWFDQYDYSTNTR